MTLLEGEHLGEQGSARCVLPGRHTADSEPNGENSFAGREERTRELQQTVRLTLQSQRAALFAARMTFAFGTETKEQFSHGRSRP